MRASNLSEMYPLRFGEFSSPVQTHKPSQYYKLKLFPFKPIKVRFDRLTLLALLDRSLTTFELIASIFLAIMVAVFGSLLLYKDFFHDLWLIVFCLVMASSQYTLLKVCPLDCNYKHYYKHYQWFQSCQPDPSSPTHGYNRLTLFSRPVYFCLISAVLLLSHNYIESSNKSLSFVIYGIDLFNENIIVLIRDMSHVLLLSFPILFSFGLLPQINTFLMYLFEQIDIHLMGGTAATMGLTSATYSLVRSVIAVSLLYVFAMIALIDSNNSTQTATFSVFCGLLLSTCYHLSRSSSDPSIYWNLIKKGFQCKRSALDLRSNNSNTDKEVHNSSQMTNEEMDSSADKTELEITDPLPNKMENTVVSLNSIETDFMKID